MAAVGASVREAESVLNVVEGESVIKVASPLKPFCNQDHSVLAFTLPSHPHLIFRPICRCDIPVVRELHDVLFPVKYNDSFYDKLLHAGGTYLHLGAWMKEGYQMVGVVTGRITDTSGVFTSGAEGYISTLGTDPRFRRQGIAGVLLDNFIVLLKKRGVDLIVLHVLSTNHTAIALYKQKKFEVIEFKKDHYFFDNAHHDAYYLTLTVKQPKGCLIV